MDNEAKINLMWAIAVTIILTTFLVGCFVVGLNVSKASYVEQTNRVNSCLNNGMQWVESSCVSK